MFVFYEDLNDYNLALLEHQKQINKDQLEDWARKIALKEDQIG